MKDHLIIIPEHIVEDILSVASTEYTEYGGELCDELVEYICKTYPHIAEENKHMDKFEEYLKKNI